MKETILVIDDEKEMLENCRRILDHSGYRCILLTGPDRVEETVRAEKPDLVITDLKMPDKDGLEVLHEIKSFSRGIPVVLFTAYATWETAVAAIKEGASDYIAKPFSAEDLLTIVDKALREKRLMAENQLLKQELGLSFGFDKLIGASPQLKEVLQTVRKISPTEANVLIQGESGTGKELIARAIHRNSKRGQGGGRFVPVDCASLPENLLEAELFGHEKGAFTDAQSSRPGIFELADGGTIFLDEIGELPLSLQAKLLRVLQEKQFRRLGSNRLITVDFRIIVATNRDLAREVREKRFREDLFYRLNVIQILVPPLRERDGDIELLARHFLREFNKSNRLEIRGFASDALQLLKGFRWPGNVRELENAIERAVTLAESDTIQAGDLPENILRAEDKGDSFNGNPCSFKEAKTRAFASFYNDYLGRLIARHKGNVSQAAEEAGIDRKTIHRILRRYRIQINK